MMFGHLNSNVFCLLCVIKLNVYLISTTITINYIITNNFIHLNDTLARQNVLSQMMIDVKPLRIPPRFHHHIL